MAKYFPHLNRTKVRIDLDGGEWVMCEMLPISALSEIEEIGNALNGAKTAEDIIAVRTRLIALISTVFPENLRENLYRLSLNNLVDLSAYLMYGDEDDAEKKNAEELKKN